MELLMSDDCVLKSKFVHMPDAKKKLAMLLAAANSNLEEGKYHEAFPIFKSLWSYLNDVRHDHDDRLDIQEKHKYAISASLCYAAIKSKQSPVLINVVIENINFESGIIFTYYLEVMHSFKQANYASVIQNVEKILKRKSALKPFNISYHGVDLLDTDNFPELDHKVMYPNLEIYALFACILENQGGKAQSKKKTFGSITKKHLQTFIKEVLDSVANIGLLDRSQDIKTKYGQDGTVKKLRTMYENVEKKDKKNIVNILNGKARLFNELTSLLPLNSDDRNHFATVESIYATYESDASGCECDHESDDSDLFVCRVGVNFGMTDISDIIHNHTLNFEHFREKVDEKDSQVQSKTKSITMRSKHCRDAQTDTDKLLQTHMKHKLVQVQPKKKHISIQTDIKPKVETKKTIVEEETLKQLLDEISQFKKHVGDKSQNNVINKLKNEIRKKEVQLSVELEKSDKEAQDLIKVINDKRNENLMIKKRIDALNELVTAKKKVCDSLLDVKKQQIQEKYTIEMLEYVKRERQCDYILNYFRSNEILQYSSKYIEYWKSQYEKMVNGRIQFISHFQKGQGFDFRNWPTLPVLDRTQFYKFFEESIVIFTLLKQFQLMEKRKVINKSLQPVAVDPSKKSLLTYLSTCLPNVNKMDLLVSLKNIFERSNLRNLTSHDVLVYLETYFSDIDNMCTICLEEFTNREVFVTKCNHKFHSHCIKLWMEKSTCCPICRADDLRVIK